MVGRIGKPHGLRGEVTVDVRTDEPERRFARGSTLRAEPPPGSASSLRQVTVESSRWHQSVLLLRLEELPDRTAAEAARGLVLHASIPADESPEDPDEFYDHQLVGLAAYDEQGVALGTVAGLVHGGAQDLLRITTPDGREALVPFVKALVPEVDVAGGRVVVADRPGLVTPFADRGRPEGPTLMRLDYLTIFPDYLAPLGQSLTGKAADKGLLELHVHDLRRWTHDRHKTVDDSPVRRGSRHGPAPRAVRRGLRRARGRRARPSWCRRRPARRSPRRWRARWRPGSGWCSCAGATRGSTSGCSTTPPPAPRWSRSRSATTSSTAARWPRWR